MAKSPLGMKAGGKGMRMPVVASQTDRWSIIPRIGEAPKIDGSLDEAAWSRASRMSGFRTAYANDPVCADSDTEIRLACDDSCLYIGIAGTTAAGEHSAAERIDILLSGPIAASTFRSIFLPGGAR